MTLLQGCMMWGKKVIVPPKLHHQVLEELQAGHLGVVKMKAMARSYMWWPGLDAQIEEKCKMCVSCHRIQKTPSPHTSAPLALANSPMAAYTH